MYKRLEILKNIYHQLDKELEEYKMKVKMHDDMENVYLSEYGIHYSRIIASWHNAGGRSYGRKFKDWLRADDLNLTEEEIRAIVNLATCGKLEWEEHARKFMEDNRDS